MAIFELTHWLKHCITRKLLKIDRYMAARPWTHQVSSGRSCVPLSQPDCTEIYSGRHGRLAETTAIGDNAEAARASHTTTNDRRPRLPRCCTARLERPACWHRFCTVTGHFQAALEDSSVWTIIRLTTDLVTCPWSFAYARINTVVNNNNNNNNNNIESE